MGTKIIKKTKVSFKKRPSFESVESYDGLKLGAYLSTIKTTRDNFHENTQGVSFLIESANSGFSMTPVIFTLEDKAEVDKLIKALQKLRKELQ